MNWLAHLPTTQPTAHAVLVLAAIAVVGLALAAVKVRGVGLGVAGVLFAGILFGHCGSAIDADILAFVRDFGLILFVFALGWELGPGFFASLRREGVRLNGLAVLVVLGGVGLTLATSVILGLSPLAAYGLLAGATTNTPALGAVQQTLKTLPGVNAEQAATPALAYAVGYPVGVFGTMATLLLVRSLFRINAEQEAEAYKAAQHQGVAPLERRNLVVENAALNGLSIGQVPIRREAGVVVSRIKRAGAPTAGIATDDTVLQVGDTLLAVGTRSALDQFQAVVGRLSELDLRAIPGQVQDRRIVVTHQRVLGKTLEELGLGDLYGVAVTRVTRATLEMTAVPDLRLQFGDMLVVVGESRALDQVAQLLGNSLTALNETNFIPIFIGIALGILVGAAPLYVAGLPAPVRLGLAGGPLVLAILLGRLGRLGPLVCYMPSSANLAFRQLGITLFLACVGLKAGEDFLPTVLSGAGLRWLAAAVLITVVPLLLIGLLARGVFKLNFVTVCGLLSGSVTDPPALAFAHTLCKTDAPSVAYATVYPLTMLLRILTAQALVLAWGP